MNLERKRGRDAAMGSDMYKRRLEKRYKIPCVIIVVIAIAALFVFQFTKAGYRITVPFRAFVEVSPNVFVHKGFAGDPSEAAELVFQAKTRVKDFFGDLTSAPLLIICDDAATITKLGGDHDTTTIVIGKAYSYIVVSSEYLNVDILAHEITHAEVHARIYEGKIATQALIPIWFDEGVALQNDYRDTYSLEAWNRYTDYGKNKDLLDEMDTAAEFYAGEVEDRRRRYTISKHEVAGWIEDNSVERLIDLLNRVNCGDDFSALYFDALGQ